MSDGFVTVTWNPPASDGGSPIIDYTVKLSNGTTVPGEQSPSQIAALNGIAVSAQVAARNAVGLGPYSVSSNSVIPAGVPTIPLGITINVGDGQVGYVITPPTSNNGAAVTNYILTTTPTTQTVNTGGATTGTFGGLTDGTTYVMHVTAVNRAGNSPTLDSSPFIPQASAQVPNAPGSFTVTPGNGQFTATATAPFNGGSAITGYVLVVSGDTNSPYSAPSPNFTITGETNGTTYGVSMYAVNAVGNGASTSVVNVTPSTIPSTPAAPSATAGTNSAILSVTPPANGGSAITQYIWRANPATVPATQTSAVPTETYPGLTASTPYTFTVIAVNANGSSAASPASTSVTPTAPPASGLAVWTQSLPNARPGRMYVGTLRGVLGKAPYTWAGGGTNISLLASGFYIGFFPAGVTSDVLSGTLTDANGTAVPFSFNISCPAISGSLTLATQGGGTTFGASAGGLWHVGLKVTGGSGRAVTLITSQTGSLTTFNVNSDPYDDGWLHVAVPKTLTTGSSTIVLQATDDSGATSNTLTITVNFDNVLRICQSDASTNTSRRPDAMMNCKFSQFLQVAGGLTSGKTMNVVSGTMPPGTSWSGLTQVGTPTASGLYTYSIAATDGTNTSQTVAVTQLVLPDWRDTRPTANTGTGYFYKNGWLYDPTGCPVFISGCDTNVSKDNSTYNYMILGGPNACRSAYFASSDTNATILADQNHYITNKIYPTLMIGNFLDGSFTSGSSSVTLAGQILNMLCTSNVAGSSLKSGSYASLKSMSNPSGCLNPLNEWSPSGTVWRDMNVATQGTISGISGGVVTVSNTAQPFNSTQLASLFLYIKKSDGTGGQMVQLTGTNGGSAGAWTYAISDSTITGYAGGTMFGGFVGCLRADGWTCPLMIDAPGAGQDSVSLVTYGPAIVASDPLQNTVLSWHLYGGGQNMEAPIVSWGGKGSSQSIVFRYPAALAGSNSASTNPYTAPTYADTIFFHGVSGMTAINGVVGPGGGYNLSGSNYTATLSVATSGMSGTPTGGYAYFGRHYAYVIAQLTAMSAANIPCIMAEFGPAFPPLTETGSHGWTTSNQAVRQCHQCGLGYMDWSWDDGTGGANNSNIGDFAIGGLASTNGKAFYSTATDLTEHGRDRIGNPQFSWLVRGSRISSLV